MAHSPAVTVLLVRQGSPAGNRVKTCPHLLSVRGACRGGRKPGDRGSTALIGRGFPSRKAAGHGAGLHSILGKQCFRMV